MSKQEKLLARLLVHPKDFTYDELATLLKGFGYEEENRGKTSGSAVRFRSADTAHIIRIHKPHPGNIMKMYVLDLVIDELRERGVIS